MTALGPWFRVYTSVLNHRKILRLNDTQFAGLVRLMAVATDNGGVIPEDLDDVAKQLRRPVGKVRELMQVLISGELMEHTPEGFVIHNWEERQFQSDVSTSRVRAFRERRRNVSVTPPETENREQRTETESEKKEEVARVARPKAKSKTSIPVDFPGDTERRSAQAAWMKIGRPDLSGSVIEEMAAFRDHHLSQNKTSADWPASWRTWVKNAPKFTPQQRMNGHGRRESPLEQSERIARDLIREDAGHEGANPGADRVPRIAVRPAADDRQRAPDMARDLLRGPEGQGR